MKLFRSNPSGSKIFIVHDLFLPHLKREHDIWIYLPPHYDMYPTRRFPVLYCNDGQNMFDDCGFGCWDADKRMDEYYIINQKAAILVGIASDKHRMKEYLPWKEGGKYARDWRETIHPYITKHFRIRRGRDYTGFAGSSLGATILLEFIAEHQDAISKFAFFSPAVEVSFEKQIEYAENIDFSHLCKLYFDIGTHEGSSQGDEELSDDDYIERANEFVSILREHSGLPALFVLDTTHAAHCEKSWRSRFLLAVDWLAQNPEYFDHYEELEDLVI